YRSAGAAGRSLGSGASRRRYCPATSPSTPDAQQHGEDHLPQVRAMVLAVAVLAQRRPAGALEVEAGRIHEHQVEPCEQVAPMREHPLLHHVLQATRRKWRAAAGVEGLDLHHLYRAMAWLGEE